MWEKGWLLSGDVTSGYQVVFQRFLPGSHVIHAQKPKVRPVETDVDGHGNRDE